MSLDDCLIGIQQKLKDANQALNDRRFPAMLTALDQIIELAADAFDLAGAMDAPSSRTGI